MRRFLVGVTVCLAVLVSAGCQSKKEFGDKKEDWAKTAPPPQYRGPGQAGGPPAGAMRGPSAPPAGFQHKVADPAASGSRR